MMHFTWMRTVSFATVLFAAALVLLGQPAFGQLPNARLTSIFPAGGNPDATFDVTLAGVELDEVSELYFTHPQITAEQKTREPRFYEEGRQIVPNEFVVTIGPDVPLGVYEARAVGKYGMSNPLSFVVGALDELLESDLAQAVQEAAQASDVNEPPADVRQHPSLVAGAVALPVEINVVVNGRSDVGGDVDYYVFTAGAGQRILLDCFARRIDSEMDATLLVYDPIGRELANSRNSHRGDPLVDIVAPRDGQYLVKVHETSYRGGPQFYYRLEVGTFPRIEFIYPPAGVPGSTADYTIYGRNLPDGEPTDLKIDGRPLEKQTVTITLPTGDAARQMPFDPTIPASGASLDGIHYRLQAGELWSNPVFVGIATAPLILEQGPNDEPSQAQRVELPCEYVGQFYPRRDHDWIAFEAQQGEVYSIELISERMGLPSDANLVIQHVRPIEPPEEAEGDSAVDATESAPTEDVRVVAVAADGEIGFHSPQFSTRTRDPVLLFEVPEDGLYRVLLRDSRSSLRAEPRNVYRLAIRSPQPDFRLLAVPEDATTALHLRKGGTAMVRVIAFRQDGFDGEITVSVSGLPKGVTAPDVVIGPGSNSAPLVLQAAKTVEAATALLELVGTARIDGKQVSRSVRYGAGAQAIAVANQLGQAGKSRLARSLALSVSADEEAPFLVQVGGDQVWEGPRGARLQIPYTIEARNRIVNNFTFRPTHIPTNSQLNNFNAANNTTRGQFDLLLTANTPPGTYTFYLDTLVQIRYRRNPEAAQWAEQRHEELVALATMYAQMATEAQTAQTEANQRLQVAQTELQQAQQALTAARQALERAQQEAANTADDEPAAARVKTAQEAVTAAEKVVEEAQKKLEEAQQAKAAADEEVQQAQARAQEVVQARNQAQQVRTQTAQAANEANRNVIVPSTAVTVRVTPGPVRIEVASPTSALKQGEALELPLAIDRLYEYDGQVTVAAALPTGVAGLQIPNATVARNASSTTLTITAAENATPGTHTITLTVTSPLNGQNVTQTVTVTLKVEAAEPASADQ